jgi:FkbM family methyltransferase
MTTFQNEVRIRHEAIDGVTDWVWPTADSGLWDGPKDDWVKLKEGILANVRKFDVVVQAGGACGMYPRLLSNLFKTVYTFEPDPLNFYCLVNNCQSPNIIKINTALGGMNELVCVVKGAPDNLGTHRVGNGEHKITPTFCIDQLNLDACDFIQLDVEGYEENVISGAMKTITRFKPVIAIETCTPKTREWLESNDYTYMGRFGHADSLFVVL